MADPSRRYSFVIINLVRLSFIAGFELFVNVGQRADKISFQNMKKQYLIAYNILSFIGWAYLLVLVLIHIFNLDGRSDAVASPPNLPTRFLLPKTLYLRASTTYSRLGQHAVFVQTFAILEIFHVLVGWVRTPLFATLMQVASRLYALWGVYQHYPQVRSNPYYTSMLLIWSTTEVIRYPFYAFTLLGKVPYQLLWLRYTTFYLLYPIGATSEAVGIYATLPISSPWKIYDYVRALLFVIWWPSLYVLYTYMIKQRRKILGPRKTVKAE